VSYELVKLGNLCEVLDGRRKPITKRDRIEGNFPYYGATGIVDYVGDFIFDEKLVLIGEDGAKWDSGEKTAFIADGKYWVNNHAHVIKPNRKLLIDEWIVYYFYFKDLKEFVTGLTVPKLNQGQLKIIPIPLPPLPTQQKIVAKIDAIFAEIDKAQAAAEANAKNAQALFQSYLTEIFESGGEGWITETIGNICTLRSGTTVNANLEQEKGELPYLKVADMNLIFNQDSITSSSRFLRISDVNKNSVIRKGATIFPKRGGAIDTNKKRITDVDIAVDLNIMSVFPSVKLDSYLLYFYFLSLDMRKLGSGASIRQINNYDIEPLIIGFPNSLDEQKELVRTLCTLKNQSVNLISNYRKKAEQLSKYKQLILQQAFSGELVKD
jgi:type I restriction enzyme S subunit